MIERAVWIITLIIGASIFGMPAGVQASMAEQRAGSPAPSTVTIPAGGFVAGSDAAERDAAYRLDETAYGHSVTRLQGWYDRERRQGRARTDAYDITTTPITNRHYAVFVRATGHPAPDVDRATCK